ncbi:hypothetical protein RCL1_005771 [Eukaryota sp. TZLM3-RCL]
MSLKEYRLGQFLGKGSFGTVYKAVRIADSREYALKTLDIQSMSQKEREDAVNECRILASVSHPNIIAYKHAFIENDKLAIVTDLATSGDLLGLIKKFKSRRQFFSEDTVWSFFIQICLGLKALHDRNILHRDLKSANIFLDGEHVVKIGDLGVAKLLKTEDQLAKTSIGTPYYLSPEIWRNRPYNSKSDVWSLGCLLYEMITFRHPFTANDIRSLSNRVLAGKYEAISPRFSKDLRDVVDSMIIVDPHRRPTIDELLQHPAVQLRMHLVPKELEAKQKPQPAVVPTIKVPRNLRVQKIKLPGPQFQRTPVRLPNITARPEDMRNERTIAKKPVLVEEKENSPVSVTPLNVNRIAPPSTQVPSSQRNKFPAMNTSPGRMERIERMRRLGVYRPFGQGMGVANALGQLKTPSLSPPERVNVAPKPTDLRGKVFPYDYLKQPHHGRFLHNRV